MKEPLFIYSPGDLILFKSVYDAENYLEVIDVKEGTYTGYDSTGRLLDIKAKENKVVITLLEQSPSRFKEFENLLRWNLEDVGISCDDIKDGDIDTLFEKAKFFELNPYSSLLEMLMDFVRDLFKALFRRGKNNK